MDEILHDSLLTSLDRWQPNEIAFSSLSSKIELPFRDKWSFALHELLSHSYTVCREFYRTDLAILDQNKNPLALIELKAIYTFDAALYQTDLNGFLKAMNNDLVKVKKLKKKLFEDGHSECQIYQLLLVCHPHSEIPNEYEKIVKYRTGINRGVRDCSGATNVKKTAVEIIDSKFEDKNVICRGQISGGEAFGISTDLLYWGLKV